MRITQDQIQALGQVTRAQFVDRLGDRIRTRFPGFVQARGLDDEGVRRLARQAVELCESHGVDRGCDVQTVVDCLLTMKVPVQAKAILSRADLSGREKASLLHDLLVFGGA